VGHSHVPFLCRENQGSPQFGQFVEDEVLPLGEERMIINPGSVGQPRDRDPRPSYAVYDSRQATIERHRVTYTINQTQEKMQEANLPQHLIDRLSHGV
jgi:diadenosine tetraphosphatase ApaH/serine/threonine PP2A family protein phosphatase